jgi:hypothetical protein
LSEEQNRRLDEYVGARRLGSAPQDYISYHPNPISDRERIKSELGLSLAQKNAVLFTNVAWDGRVHAPDGIFPGPIEWVLDTLRYLGGRPDIRVIVRVHPAEVKNKKWITQQRLDDEIQRAFPALPANVTVIPPESDINSYTLADLADVAIVYSTKMGLESALMGIPLIIAGSAFYGQKGIGIDPRTHQEYHEALDRIPQMSRATPAELERIRRYAFHYYFCRTLELPVPYPNSFTRQLKTMADLTPGKQHGLDIIADGILNGSPFVDEQG